MNHEPKSLEPLLKEKNMESDSEGCRTQTNERSLNGLAPRMGRAGVFRKPLVQLLVLCLLCTTVVAVQGFETKPAQAHPIEEIEGGEEGEDFFEDGSHDCVFAPQEAHFATREGFCHDTDGDVVECSRTVTAAIPEAVVFISCEPTIGDINAITGDNCQVPVETAADPQRITCGLTLTNQVVECPSTLSSLDLEECHDVADKTDWVPPTDDAYSEQFCESTTSSSNVPIQQGLNETYQPYYTEHSLCMDFTGTLYHCVRQGFDISGDRACNDTTFHTHHGLGDMVCGGVVSVATDPDSAVCNLGQGEDQRTFKCFNASGILGINSLYNCTLADTDFVPLNETESKIVYQTNADADYVITNPECETTVALLTDEEISTADLSDLEERELYAWGEITGLLHESGPYDIDPETNAGFSWDTCTQKAAFIFSTLSAVGNFFIASTLDEEDATTAGGIFWVGTASTVAAFWSAISLWRNFRADQRRNAAIAALGTQLHDMEEGQNLLAGDLVTVNSQVVDLSAEAETARQSVATALSTLTSGVADQAARTSAVELIARTLQSTDEGNRELLDRLRADYAAADAVSEEVADLFRELPDDF